MSLQQQDFIKAQAIQKELLKLLPNDPTIKAFSKYLPLEVEYQKEAIREDEEALANAEYESEDDEDYDEEKDSDEEAEKKDGDQENSDEPKTEEITESDGDAKKVKEAWVDNADENAPNVTSKESAEGEELINTAEASKDGNQDKEEESEYDSQYDPEDYDEEGKYIWGKEGEDWDFYYKEDKEAYEKGLSMVPEPLNPEALPEYEEMLN